MINGHNETQRRLKKFMYVTGQYTNKYSYIGVTSGVEWVEEGGYYKKWSVTKEHGNRKKFYQDYGNRKTRHYKGEIKNGRHCFKIYNALWEIW